MSEAVDTPNARINLRLKRGVKTLLERAASFEGKTVSNFILSSAIARAEKTVSEHETMTLRGEDAEAFIEALSGKVTFNKDLIEALREHEERVDSQ